MGKKKSKGRPRNHCRQLHQNGGQNNQILLEQPSEDLFESNELTKAANSDSTLCLLNSSSSTEKVQSSSLINERSLESTQKELHAAKVNECLLPSDELMIVDDSSESRQNLNSTHELQPQSIDLPCESLNMDPNEVAVCMKDVVAKSDLNEKGNSTESSHLSVTTDNISSKDEILSAKQPTKLHTLNLTKKDVLSGCADGLGEKHNMNINTDTNDSFSTHGDSEEPLFEKHIISDIKHEYQVSPELTTENSEEKSILLVVDKFSNLSLETTEPLINDRESLDENIMNPQAQLKSTDVSPIDNGQEKDSKENIFEMKTESLVNLYAKTTIDDQYKECSNFSVTSIDAMAYSETPQAKESLICQDFPLKMDLKRSKNVKIKTDDKVLIKQDSKKSKRKNTKNGMNSNRSILDNSTGEDNNTVSEQKILHDFETTTDNPNSSKIYVTMHGTLDKKSESSNFKELATSNLDEEKRKSLLTGEENNSLVQNASTSNQYGYFNGSQSTGESKTTCKNVLSNSVKDEDKGTANFSDVNSFTTNVEAPQDVRDEENKVNSVIERSVSADVDSYQTNLEAFQTDRDEENKISSAVEKIVSSSKSCSDPKTEGNEFTICAKRREESPIHADPYDHASSYIPYTPKNECYQVKNHEELQNLAEEIDIPKTTKVNQMKNLPTAQDTSLDDLQLFDSSEFKSRRDDNHGKMATTVKTSQTLSLINTKHQDEGGIKQKSDNNKESITISDLKNDKHNMTDYTEIGSSHSVESPGTMTTPAEKVISPQIQANIDKIVLPADTAMLKTSPKLHSNTIRPKTKVVGNKHRRKEMVAIKSDVESNPNKMASNDSVEEKSNTLKQNTVQRKTSKTKQPKFRNESETESKENKEEDNQKDSSSEISKDEKFKFNAEKVHAVKSTTQESLETQQRRSSTLLHFGETFPSRPVFMANTCHVCKSTHEGTTRLKSCAACRLITYCGKQHQREHWKEHKGICQQIQKMMKQSSLSDIFAEAHKISDPEEWRQYRCYQIFETEKQIGRPLLPYEKEMFLYPRVCSACHKSDPEKLKVCKTCHYMNYCCSEHIPNNHHLWCNELKLLLEINQYQSRNGLIKPHIPDCFINRSKPFPGSMKAFLSNSLLKVQETNYFTLYETALSDIGSYPLTILYVLEYLKHGIVNANSSSKLTIHLVGAEYQFEVDPLSKWDLFLLNLLPNLTELNLVFIGPELMPNGIATRNCNYEKKLCKTRNPSKKLVAEFYYSKLYHDYAKGKSFSKPDVICAFNCGIYRFTGFNNQDTWGPTMSTMVKYQDTLVILTAYTAVEAPKDVERFQKECEIEVLMPPAKNPFASMRPNLNFVSDDETPLIYKNQFLSVIKGSGGPEKS